MERALAGQVKDFVPRHLSTGQREAAAWTPSSSLTVSEVRGDGRSPLEHWLCRSAFSLISLDRSLSIIYLFKELAFGFIDFPLLSSILPVSTLTFDFLVLPYSAFLRWWPRSVARTHPASHTDADWSCTFPLRCIKIFFFSFSSKILSLLILSLDQLS